jgi:hypothetical protein
MARRRTATQRCRQALGRIDRLRVSAGLLAPDTVRLDVPIDTWRGRLAMMQGPDAC